MSALDIERLAAALDGTEAPASDDAATLAAIADTLRTSTAAAPSAAFKESLRAELITAARTQADTPQPLRRRMGTTPRQRTSRWRPSYRLVAATVLGALVISTGSVAVAAWASGPSSALYPLKIALEDARLALASTGLERAEQAFAFVGDRLDEATVAVDASDMAGAAVALVGADELTREGAAQLAIAYAGDSDDDLLAQLSDFARTQQVALRALRGQLSGRALAAEGNFNTSLDRVSGLPAVLRAPPCDCPGAWRPGMAIPAPDEPFVPCPCTPAQSGGDPSAPPTPVRSTPRPAADPAGATAPATPPRPTPPTVADPGTAAAPAAPTAPAPEPPEPPGASEG